MNENMKYDINGSVNDSLVGIFKHLSGMALVALLFGFLVAPIFADFFRPSLEEMYNTKEHPANFIVVAQKMLYVKAVLWVIAGLGWLIVFGYYATRYAY